MSTLGNQIHREAKTSGTIKSHEGALEKSVESPSERNLLPYSKTRKVEQLSEQNI